MPRSAHAPRTGDPCLPARSRRKSSATVRTPKLALFFELSRLRKPSIGSSVDISVPALTELEDCYKLGLLATEASEGLDSDEMHVASRLSCLDGMTVAQVRPGRGKSSFLSALGVLCG